MREGKIKYLFPGGNTPKGFHSYYRENLNNLENIFILKGGPGVGKSTLIRKIGLSMQNRGYDLEFWQCSSDTESLDAVVIPALSLAVLDGTAPHMIDPLYPGAVDEIINLGNHWDGTYLKNHREEIKSLTKTISNCFAQAYEKLAMADDIRRTQKEISQADLDTEHWEKTMSTVITDIFQNTEPKIRNIFASAITPKGLMGFGNNITAKCHKRYILTGPPSNSKTIFMQKIADLALAKGYDLDIYHSPFDIEEIEILHIPALNIAFIDNQPPNDQNQQQPGDTIINLDQNQPQPDDKLTVAFNKLLEEAVMYIGTAKKNHDLLENYYIKAMDFEGVDEEGNKLFNKILAIASQKEKI